MFISKMLVSKMETWKEIDEFPEYQVSNLGNVRSCKFDKINVMKLDMRERDEKGTYLYACLYKNGISFNRSVHRLVALAFIANPLNKPEIDHLNHNGIDNRVENLRWVTRSENLLNRNMPIGSSGHKYIIINANGNFRVSIKRNSKTVYNKTYKTLEEAIAARNTFLET